MCAEWASDAAPIITIGNFDGFHLGHMALLQEAQKHATEEDCRWGVVTFTPHPREFFSQKPVPKIYNPELKHFFLEHGTSANFLCTQPFDASFSKLSPEEFLDNLLTPYGPVKRIVVGDNFRYGKNRQGDVRQLAEDGQKRGIQVSVVNPILVEDQTACSSLIRKIIADKGDVQLVRRFLGRNYEIVGLVTKGRQVGRTIGFPTANLRGISQVLPKSGVYAGVAKWGGQLDEIKEVQPQPAVINIGRNPTVATDEKKDLSVEVHLIGSTLDNDALYGKLLAFQYVQRIRPEFKFTSLEALKQQINRDCSTASAIIKAAKMLPSVLF